MSALSLGLTITTTWTAGPYGEVPGGCSISDGGDLHFNTNYFTLECCKGRHDLRPICKNTANTELEGTTNDVYYKT